MQVLQAAYGVLVHSRFLRELPACEIRPYPGFSETVEHLPDRPPPACLAAGSAGGGASATRTLLLPPLVHRIRHGLNLARGYLLYHYLIVFSAILNYIILLQMAGYLKRVKGSS